MKQLPGNQRILEHFEKMKESHLNHEMMFLIRGGDGEENNDPSSNGGFPVPPEDAT